VEHVVFFPAPDGAPVFRRVVSLEEAVRLVEHLRNVDGIAEVAVHPLGAEVPLAFRAWYRVEVPAGAAAAPAAEPAVEPVAELPAEAPVEAVLEPVVPAQPEPEADLDAEPVPVLVEVAPNGHSAEGVKSLGFFA
jgi:hypothetical protein